MRRVFEELTCDRCGKEISKKEVEVQEGTPQLGGAFVVRVELDGKEVAAFMHLCPECDKAVRNILERVRLKKAGETE